MFDLGERCIPHGLRAVPESIARRAMERDPIGFAADEIVEIVSGSVFTAVAIVILCRGAKARRNTRRDILRRRDKSFDNMPMPRDRELRKNMFVVANERLAIRNEGEKMNRQHQSVKYLVFIKA